MNRFISEYIEAQLKDPERPKRALEQIESSLASWEIRKRWAEEELRNRSNEPQ